MTQPKASRLAGRSALLLLVTLSGAMGCDALFNHDAPAVEEARALLDDGGGGDARAERAALAAERLQRYLDLAACGEGFLPTDKHLEKSAAAYDLGLALFAVGESFGERFDATAAPNAPPSEARRKQATCALGFVKRLRADETQPWLLRQRAAYLEGNLHLLLADYDAAIAAYDLVLGWLGADTPPSSALPNGISHETREALLATAKDAAYNRAIALRRRERDRDGGPPDASEDAAPDAPSDGAADAPSDAAPDASEDAAPDAAPDAPNDGAADAQADAQDAGGGDGGRGVDGGRGDGGAGDGGQDNPDERSADAGQTQQDGGSGQTPPQGAPPPASGMDERILDELDRAPSFQKEVAKTLRKRTHPTEDK
jgi:hypothetical protein